MRLGGNSGRHLSLATLKAGRGEGLRGGGWGVGGDSGGHISLATQPVNRQRGNQDEASASRLPRRVHFPTCPHLPQPSHLPTLWPRKARGMSGKGLSPVYSSHMVMPNA